MVWAAAPGAATTLRGEGLMHEDARRPPGSLGGRLILTGLKGATTIRATEAVYVRSDMARGVFIKRMTPGYTAKKHPTRPPMVAASAR